MEEEFQGFKNLGKRTGKSVLVGAIVPIFILVFSSFLLWSGRIERERYLIVIVVVIIMMVALMAFFYYRILQPVIILEETINSLIEGGNGRFLGETVEEDAVIKDLTRIIRSYQSSVEHQHNEILLRQEAEYAELQSQINPHFLYNILETIRGQALIDDNYKIADMTEALAKYFRYNIGKDNDKVTVMEELENVYNYIKIQQFRFNNRFTFQIHTDDAKEEYKSCMLPKMTLQPVIENAIFHGIEGKLERGRIDVHIVTTKERLIITVADDGIGMKEETLRSLMGKLNQSDIRMVAASPNKRGNGIAVDNVNKRLKLLFGTEYGINVSSTWMVGTEVEITIPKIQMEVM